MSAMGEATGGELPAPREAREARPAGGAVAAAAPAAAAARPWWRSAATVFLHLAGLWAVAFVQPLFDLLGKNAAFFIARDNTAGDILIFAFAFTLLPPLVMTALVLGARAIHRRAGQVLMLGFIAVMVGALVLQVLKKMAPDAGTVLVVLALLVGAVAALAYERFQGPKSLLTVLGAAPAVVLAFFLVFSPVSEIVFPRDSPTAVAAGSGGNGTPVVLMIFDEYPTMTLMDRSERVDRRKFPNFARLGRESTWYRNATGAADGTYVAVPAILSGLKPQEKLPTDRSYPRNLFSLVGKTYDLHVQEPITHVCSPKLCGARARRSQSDRLTSLAKDLRIVEQRLLLPDKLVNGLPPIDRDWEDFSAENGDDGLAEAAAKSTPASGALATERIRVAGNDLPAQRLRAGRAVVHTMKPGRKPGLWMVHYVVPHVPWRFLPDGTQYVVDGPNMPGLTDQTWNRNAFELDQAWQRHFLMAKFADNLLGEAIDRMKATGLWDKAIVIVTADHGGSIEPGGQRRPITTRNFAPVAGVPLFVKLPGQKAGRVDDALVHTIDVVPTIAKALGIQSGWKFDGKPLDEPHDDTTLFMRNGRRAKYVKVGAETFKRERRALLRRQLAKFPTFGSIWRIGPNPQLVGRAVSGLPRHPATSARAQIDGSRLYGRVNHASGVLPVYVTGELSGVRAGAPIAVAVNGRVRASAQAYSDGGDVRYSALVPPATLRRGANRVEVFEVNGGALRPLARVG